MQSFCPDLSTDSFFCFVLHTRERAKEECQQVFNSVEDVTMTQGVDTTATCESETLLVHFQRGANYIPCILFICHSHRAQG